MFDGVSAILTEMESGRALGGTGMQIEQKQSVIGIGNSCDMQVLEALGRGDVLACMGLLYVYASVCWGQL